MNHNPFPNGIFQINDRMVEALRYTLLALALLQLRMPFAAAAAACNERDDEASLLQLPRHFMVSGISQADQQTCNQTVPVKGSSIPVPARGFTTCCNKSISKSKMVQSLRSYLSLGGRLIDTAPNYGYEKEVGEVVRASEVPRKELWLSSKVQTDEWNQSVGLAKEWTLAQVDQSLAAMGLSYLDSIVLHYGPAAMPFRQRSTSKGVMGPTEHVEMWRGLMEAKALGKVHNIGVAETTRSEIENLIRATGETPAIVFLWYNPWVPVPQKDYLGWLQSTGVTVLAMACSISNPFLAAVGAKVL
jgi:glycerol 2-dehydrogenase (NADP+)